MTLLAMRPNRVAERKAKANRCSSASRTLYGDVDQPPIRMVKTRSGVSSVIASRNRLTSPSHESHMCLKLCGQIVIAEWTHQPGICPQTSAKSTKATKRSSHCQCLGRTAEIADGIA